MDEMLHRKELLVIESELLVFIVPLANSAFLKEVPIISYGVLIKESNL